MTTSPQHHTRPSGTVLDAIIAGVLEDLTVREREWPLAEVVKAAEAARTPIDPLPAFRAPGLAIISEVKRSSPSKGALATIGDPAQLASQYEAGGASAISVLTEQRKFGGSLADLRAVRERVSVPVLRKDFVVTDYQVYEARANGADLVLLIVAALDDRQLHDLYALAKQLGLTPLVEVHTVDEATRARELGAELVGVNNRNLKTLDVDLGQFERLVAELDNDAVKVAESGILSPADARRMAQAGADVILVGEALVTKNDPQKAVREMIAAGSEN